MAMNGNQLGDEIAVAIRASVIEYLVLEGLLEVIDGEDGPIFQGAFAAFILRFFSPWTNVIWRAIGRAIVSHIQDNMVVTVRVENYSAGILTNDFESVEIE